MSEQVAARIKQLIIDEGLKPGNRLPTEQEMADRFGVSRVSVREATKALSFLGIIHAAPRRGLTIGEVDMGRVTEYLGFHFALGNYPKRELLQTRLVIESGALPYISQAMAAQGNLFDRLVQLIESSKPIASMRKRMESDLAFHHELIAASGMGPLRVFDDLLQIFFGQFAPDLSDDQWKLATDHHARLIRLLRDGEVENARQLLSEHLGTYSSRIGD